MAEHHIKLEYEYLIEHQSEIFDLLSSNRQAVQNQYKQIAKILNKKLSKFEVIVDLNLALDKLNAYVAMAQLNEVAEHELVLRKITRLPVLFFKLHLNKLRILDTLSIDGADSFMHQLPAEIGLLTQLKALSLAGCHLSALPKEIGFLKNLEILNLNNNHFEKLPEEIGQLSALKECTISYDPKLKQLPLAFWNLNKLEILKVSHNQLKIIPKDIGKLKALRKLDMDFNQVAIVPAELAKLTKLEELHLRHNQLRKLQLDVSKMTKLKLLDVAENPLEALSEAQKKLIH